MFDQLQRALLAQHDEGVVDCTRALDVVVVDVQVHVADLAHGILDGVEHVKECPVDARQVTLEDEAEL
eukprot:5270607-Heterocapsa_arctica.AAC.1